MFEEFKKIARLRREVVVTEKIDGANAQVLIVPETAPTAEDCRIASINGFSVYAGSRSRFITPGMDNFNFAQWVALHAEELVSGLGEGRHYGEWWGLGIQRAYGQKTKRFSLFNTHRWAEVRPECCDVVPVLYEGVFSTEAVDVALADLATNGSRAAPGFMRPEGVVVFHKAGNVMFKQTIEKDEEPKSRQERSKGGTA